MNDSQPAIDAPFDEQIIYEYLSDTPDFFNKHPDLLLSMQIPHSARGAVSLVERRQEMLREKVQQLEEEITTLISVATHNETIYSFNRQLTFKLLDCDTVEQLNQVLSSELKEAFGFSHVCILAEINDERLNNVIKTRLHKGYYLGRLTNEESHILFSTTVGSVSLVKLTLSDNEMIFAVAKDDIAHFNPAMDCTFLDYLRELLEHLLLKLQ